MIVRIIFKTKEESDYPNIEATYIENGFVFLVRIDGAKMMFSSDTINKVMEKNDGN